MCSKLRAGAALLAVALGLSSTSAFARAKRRHRNAQSTELHYGMAGCGVGSMVFTNDTTGSQLGATFVQYWAPGLVAGTGFYSVVIGILASNDGVAGVGAVLLAAGIVADVAFFPTWAISSGTSNCVPSSRAQTAEMEQRLFITTNLPSLSKEASRGSGEHLDALATLAGCQGALSKAIYAKTVQREYADLFGETDPGRVADRVVALADEDEDLASRCVLE